MATNVELDKVWAFGTEFVIVPFQFAVNGSSDPVTTTVKGNGVAVTHAATGLYSVTFTPAYSAPIAMWAHLGKATGDADSAVIKAYTASTKVLQIATVVSGSLADITAGTGIIVYGCMVCPNSGVTP